jgi:undecaprenyl-diphosphatase
MAWIEALVLGLVQGLTEFLPVSSDGHLKITQDVFDFFRGRTSVVSENLFFDVMLHLGTLAAILLHHRAVVGTGARGLLGSTEVAPAYQRKSVVRVGLLAFVATLPLVPDALYFKPLIEQAFESLKATGVGFLITAAVLALTLRFKEGTKGPRETLWIDALMIGLAQALAPLPGVSRSALTVAMALAMGLSRSWAVGFSLLLAVPAISGAAVFELKKLDPNTLSSERISQTVAAAIVAGIVGYMAIIWLIKVVRYGRLWYFSVYLVILGAIVIGIGSMSRGNGDGTPSDAPDGPQRRGAARSSPGPADRPGDGVDRPHSAGLLADPRPVDPAPGIAAGTSRLDVARPLA